jgi:hypothetical protein
MHANLEDLANLVFLLNHENKFIDLTLPNLENTKELFFFCVNLFCRGLSLLMGDDGTRVSISHVTFEVMNKASDRIKYVGIQPILTHLNNDDARVPVTGTNLLDLYGLADDLPVHEFTIYFRRTDNTSYSLRFVPFHNIEQLPNGRRCYSWDGW